MQNRGSHSYDESTLDVACTCEFMRPRLVRGGLWKTSLQNWDQLRINIFRVCPCVQTLTQTMCPVRGCVTQAGLVPLIVHLETETGYTCVHLQAHTCLDSVKVRGSCVVLTRTHTHAQVDRYYMCALLVVAAQRPAAVLLMGVLANENV